MSKAPAAQGTPPSRDDPAPVENGETIRVVSKRTGLSMEVLRAWERRFGFPKPERRADSNRRLYSRADIERLLAICRALDGGYRIGDVIAKSLPELDALGVGPLGFAPALRAGLEENGASTNPADRLIALLARDDVSGLESELRRAAATLGSRRFVTELAQPFVVAVGEAWAEGRFSIRHEHVASECLATRLRTMLDPFQDVDRRPVVVLATLANELHTLPLLMVAVYLADAGAKPRLLGGPTPVADIAETAQKLGADVVGITVMPSADRAEVRRALRTLARGLTAGVALWVGGAAAPLLDLDVETTHVLTSWTAIDDALASWRRGARRR